MCTYLKRLMNLFACALLFTAANAQNPIVTENALPGNPSSEWMITGAGDLTIQGFATDFSINRGNTVRFKIRTNASDYTINIYRLGWYNGDGARLVGTGVITASLPQVQPDPITNTTTGLVDCGNWSESAHWDIPANAVSGIYIARREAKLHQSAAAQAVAVSADPISSPNTPEMNPRDKTKGS